MVRKENTTAMRKLNVIVNETFWIQTDSIRLQTTNVIVRKGLSVQRETRIEQYCAREDARPFQMTSAT